MAAPRVGGQELGAGRGEASSHRTHQPGDNNCVETLEETTHRMKTADHVEDKKGPCLG